MSVRSSFWPSSPDGQSHRSAPARTLCQPGPEYSPVIRCIPRTRVFTTTIKPNSHHLRSSRTTSGLYLNLSSFARAKYTSSAYQRARKKTSRRALLKHPSNLQQGKKALYLTQEHRLAHSRRPTSSSTVPLSRQQPISIMARKNSSKRPAMSASQQGSRQSRRGRFIATVPDDQPAVSTSVEDASDSQPTNQQSASPVSSTAAQSSIVAQPSTLDQLSVTAQLSIPKAVNQAEDDSTTLTSLVSATISVDPKLPSPSSSTSSSPLLNARALRTNPTQVRLRPELTNLKPVRNQPVRDPLSPESLPISSPYTSGLELNIEATSTHQSDLLTPSPTMDTDLKTSLNTSLLTSRKLTPEAQLEEINDSSSELSSVPNSVESTPEQHRSPRRHRPTAYLLDQSPSCRLKRKLGHNEDLFGSEDSPQENKKRRRVSFHSDVDVLSTNNRSPQQREQSSQDVAQDTSTSETSHSLMRTRLRPRRSISITIDEDHDIDAETDLASRQRAGTNKAFGKKSLSNTLSRGNINRYISRPKLTKAEMAKKRAESARERRFYAELEEELFSEPQSSRKIWTGFNPKKIVMFGSDAQTQYTPAIADAEQSAADQPKPDPPKRSGKNNGRGGSRSARGGSGNGRGRGGKRASGRGRDEESPEPPAKKHLSQEDALLIKHAKARQAELRKFFNIVGAHQAETLDAIASRDLGRLARKPKAHEKVDEYEELLADIQERKKVAEDLIREQYRLDVEAENEGYEAEKIVVKQKLAIKIADIQDECRKGAQGDLIIFQRAVAAAQDDTRTQDGSETDYFPHYHDFPEPDRPIRGYALSRMYDEKPFKHHLRTYDDEATREVIDADVGPIIQAFAQKNAERRAAEERKKTQTMEALSDEAEKRLKEIKGYLIPRPLPMGGPENSFALSCLADVSEWMARQYPNKQYVYMPLEDGDTFPREALNYEPLPGRGVAFPQPPMQPQYRDTHSSRRHIVSKPTPASKDATPRHSLRDLQPSASITRSQVLRVPVPRTEHSSAPSATSAPSGLAPILAPAPPRLAPAPSGQQHPYPPPINTKVHTNTPPEQSPVHTPHSQPQSSSVYGLPPLQPRHMSQSSLPPPPPGYQYPLGPSPFSPTHPPSNYPHQGAPSPYTSLPPPPPSPYRTNAPMPSPYVPHPPPIYGPYGQQQYSYPLPPPPPPPQQQQQFAFMPPQQGPAPPHQSSMPQPHSRSQSIAGPPSASNQQQGADPFRNGFHHRPSSLTYAAQSVPQVNQAPAPSPARSTSTAKSRAKPRAKNPVTFVNQTLATRKAAAEQIAKEEAAAAAERKERDKDKRGGTIAMSGNTNADAGENGNTPDEVM